LKNLRLIKNANFIFDCVTLTYVSDLKKKPHGVSDFLTVNRERKRELESEREKERERELRSQKSNILNSPHAHNQVFQ
jgi:hypothetical protein